MSLNFTVQKVEEYIRLPDGKYTAQIDHVEYVSSDYGNHHLVQFKILNPSEFEGRVHKERYKIEHENSAVRHIAINNFSRFCIDIGQLKEGDDPKESDFLFKVVEIYLRNNLAKDGKIYTNMVSAELMDGRIPEVPDHLIVNTPVASVVQSPVAALPFDDEVPF